MLYKFISLLDRDKYEPIIISLKPKEAIAAAKPIIAPDAGDTAEILSRAPGIIIPPNDLVALVSAIKQIMHMDDKEEYVTRDNVQKKVAGIVVKVEGLYDKLL